jgi:hypothetical protein
MGMVLVEAVTVIYKKWSGLTDMQDVVKISFGSGRKR